MVSRRWPSPTPLEEQIISVTSLLCVCSASAWIHVLKGNIELGGSSVTLCERRSLSPYGSGIYCMQLTFTCRTGYLCRVQWKMKIGSSLFKSYLDYQDSDRRTSNWVTKCEALLSVASCVIPQGCMAIKLVLSTGSSSSHPPDPTSLYLSTLFIWYHGCIKQWGCVPFEQQKL